jgi:MarR family transcriptional regulator, 2-MHQ and catechol-resistance regulon repressor
MTGEGGYLSTKMNRTKATRKGTDTTPRRDPAVEIPLKLWVVLARASAAVGRQAELDISRHGVTAMEFGILEVLHHKGPLLLGEIQRKLLVTSGGITYLVDRLEEKGLVTRQECPEDRRARYAVLTPAGQALIRRIFPAHAKAIARALSGLTRQEQLEATKLLRRLGVAAAELPDN